MQMRPDIQISSMITALINVIMPAIPAENKLAVEQAKLLAGMLGLMQFQLPRQFNFDRDELERLTATAEKICGKSFSDTAVGEAIDALMNRRQQALGILARCQGAPSELYASVLDMRAALCALVDAVAESADNDGWQQVSTLISDMSGEQLLRDRSLLKPQSWEVDPDAIPHIDSLLAGGN